MSAHPSRPRPHRRNPARAFLAIAAVLGLGLVGPAASVASWSFSGASTGGSQTPIDSAPHGAPQDSRSSAATTRPNVLVIESDDQTLKSMRVMSNVNSLIGDQGATFQNSFVNYSLCCPSRATFLTGQYEHNHGVTDNTAPTGGFGRFESLHGDNNLAVWLQDAGYYTAMIGKYLNDYANQPAGAPRLVGVARGGSRRPGRLQLQAERERHLVHYGQDPADFKQDVLTEKAVDFVDRRAPQRAAVLPLAHLHGPAHRRPGPEPEPAAATAPARQSRRRATPTRSTPSRCRGPRTSTRQTSPTSPPRSRNHPLLTSDQVTNIQRKYRCELESLLSVDEGVKKVVDALRANGELDNTLLVYTSDNGFFHGEHRIPNGKQRIYEESIRVPLQMRGPGIPAGRERPRPVDQRRPGADDRRRGERQPRPGHGRTLADPGRPAIRVSSQGRELLIEEPELRGDPHRALHVRRAQHGREGALRPAEGPVRASESPQRPGLRVRQSAAR